VVKQVPQTDVVREPPEPKQHRKEPGREAGEHEQIDLLKEEKEEKEEK